MSALVSHFTDLPVEITERIFLHLPGQDIVKMEAVWGIVSSSVQSGFDFVLVWPRSVDVFRISSVIPPPFSIDASSSLLVWPKTHAFLVISLSV